MGTSTTTTLQSCILAVHSLSHLSICLQSFQIWAGAVAAGQAHSNAAYWQLGLAVYEVANASLMGFNAWIYLLQRMNRNQRKDCVLISCLLGPWVQFLMAMNNPSRLSSNKNWAVYMAWNMGAGVFMIDFSPLHSLVQFLAAVVVFTFLSCYGRCYQAQQCSASPWNMLPCFAVQATAISAASFIAWAAAHILTSKHSHRLVQLSSHAQAMEQQLSSDDRTHAEGSRVFQTPMSSFGRPAAQQLLVPPAAQEVHVPPVTAAHVDEGSGLKPASGMDGLSAQTAVATLHLHAAEQAGVTAPPGDRATWQATPETPADAGYTGITGDAGVGPGNAGILPAAAGYTGITGTGPAAAGITGTGSAAAGINGTGPAPAGCTGIPGNTGTGPAGDALPREPQAAASGTPPSSPDAPQLPFESLGTFFLTALGLRPMLVRLQQWADAFGAGMNEALIIRLICLPIAAASLALAVFARMQYQMFAFDSLTPDTFLVIAASWFMVGRDSYNYDIVPIIMHIERQLQASFVRAAHRPTLLELVDNLRQHIMGEGDCRENAAPAAEEEEVQVLELLGEGAFGKVYKGLWRGTFVAMKSIILPNQSYGKATRERMAIMEAAISSALQHPNIVQTHKYRLQQAGDEPLQATRRSAGQLAGESLLSHIAMHDNGHGHASSGGMNFAFDDASQSDCRNVAIRGLEVRLLLEFCDHGTLRQAIDKGTFKSTSAASGVNLLAVLETSLDMARGMQHLHSLNVIHSDFKPGNVLLKSSITDPRGFIAKVSDFGMSFKMDQSVTHLSNLFQGTASHMAPEVHVNGNQSKAADVYSFGITLWELYTSGVAFAGAPKAALGHRVNRGDRPTFPPSTPEKYSALVKSCWSGEPSSRPTFEDIIDSLTELRRTAEQPQPPLVPSRRLQSEVHDL